MISQTFSQQIEDNVSRSPEKALRVFTKPLYRGRMYGHMHILVIFLTDTGGAFEASGGFVGLHKASIHIHICTFHSFFCRYGGALQGP